MLTIYQKVFSVALKFKFPLFNIAVTVVRGGSLQLIRLVLEPLYEFSIDFFFPFILPFHG